MSRALEERVWSAQPLSAEQRLILLAVARAVTEGESVVLINRTALARALGVNASTIRRAFLSAEVLGVLHVDGRGAVVFASESLPFAGQAKEVHAAQSFSSELSEDQNLQSSSRSVISKISKNHSSSSGETEIVERRSADSRARREVITEFARQWARRYKQSYHVVWARDMRLVERFNLTAIPTADLNARMARYLASTDPFLASRSHPFPLFCSKVNEVVGQPKASGYDPELEEELRRTKARNRGIA